MRFRRCPSFSRSSACSRTGGAELDLLVVRGGRKYGFEVKYADGPRTTKSMRVALADLELERLFIVYPGARQFDLDERITALPLGDVAATVGPL